MAYKRQISYMDMLENEIKRGNAGFVKWEKYDECHILSVFVNGVGEGTYLLTRGEKDWVEEIGDIRIPLEAGKELIAEFEGENQEIAGSRTEPEPSIAVEETEVPIGEMSYDDEESEVQDESVEKPFWEQLKETHELMYPLGNDIGCYRIFPKDISRMHANYHGLQNNQFLMHGYYNYRHLIIFPKKDGENEYWLGVPGIYHEREKMAARMYGFEKFEGTKKEYRTGDMGYYLIMVE